MGIAPEAELLSRTYRSSTPLSSLRRMIGARPWWYLGALLLFTVKLGPVIMLPLFITMVVKALGDESTPQWWPWTLVAGFTGLILLNPPTHILSIRMVSARVRRMEHVLRAALVRRLQQLSIGYLGQAETGRLQAKVLRSTPATRHRPGPGPRPAHHHPRRGHQCARRRQRKAGPGGPRPLDRGPHDLHRRPPPVDHPRRRPHRGMAQGQIVEQGAREELLAQDGAFARLLHMQT